MSTVLVDCWACDKKLQHGQSRCVCKAMNKNLTQKQVDFLIYGPGVWVSPPSLPARGQMEARWENGKHIIVTDGKKVPYNPKLHGPGGFNSLRRSG